MKITNHTLPTTTLDSLPPILLPALRSNYASSTATIENCPDFCFSPYHLPFSGLSGLPTIGDVGGQPNLFPTPNLSARYSLLKLAEVMSMPSKGGMLLGAGAGPWFDVGCNSELAPNLSWTSSSDSWDDVKVNNNNYFVKIDTSHPGHSNNKPKAVCGPCPTANCALMMNLFSSLGQPGPVLKVTARGRIGSEASLTMLIRKTLASHFGPNHPVSIGGVFLIKSGNAKYHVMPDFPPKEQLPFKDAKQLNDWLTYHTFGNSEEKPMVCFTVFHTNDLTDEEGGKLGLRMEHTHCFRPGGEEGGHYHGDVEGEEVEYEGYFVPAERVVRIDKPDVRLERLERDLQD